MLIPVKKEAGTQFHSHIKIMLDTAYRLEHVQITFLIIVSYYACILLRVPSDVRQKMKSKTVY